jgi:hypothetical protein
MFGKRFGHILRNVGRYHSRSKRRATLGKGRRLRTSQIRYKSLTQTPRRKPVMSTPNNGDFDPDDLAELSAVFSGIIRDADQGYVMEFLISRADAKEIIAVWNAARKGDQLSLALCLHEFGKIVTELERAVKRDDD